jgi:hypothetical protein
MSNQTTNASDYLVRVAAPHFVAGLVMESATPEDKCARAAPILAWAVGKPRSELRRYFASKGWTATIETGKGVKHT